MLVKRPEYNVVVDKKVVEPAQAWCLEQLGSRWEAIGNRSGNWCCFWAGFRGENAGKYIFHFTHYEDAVLFALKWQ